MADNVEIQGLEFEIEGKTTQANKGIDSLVNSFSKLKAALKGASGLSKMTDSLGKISQSINGTQSDKITSLSNALSGLSNVRISATVPKRLAEIGAALNTITWSGVERVEALSGALQGMTGVQLPNLAAQGGTTPPVTPAADAGSGLDSATQDVESTTQAVTRATSAAGVLKNVLSGLGGVFSKTFYTVGRTALSGLVATLSKVGSAAKAAVGAGKKLISTFGAKMAAPLKKATSGFKKLFSSIARIAMYRAIRFFFSQLTQAMKEGINNLYRYSELMGGQFKGSMDSLATSFQYLKNSMGAMVSPLINAIAPAVDFLIDKFVTLLNVVNQFFARLSGASSFTKAKKAAASYGDSLGNAAGAAKKAAKEIKDATTGIDELNIISQNDDSSNGGGGGGGGNYGDMFETVPIDSAISDFADRLKELFNAGDWEGLGKFLGEKVNELVDKIDWAGIGTKLGKGINAAFTVLYHFLDTIDFEKIGRGVATLLNNAFEQIDFTLVGKTFAKKWTILVDLLYGFVTIFKWDKFGLAIADFINGWFEEIDLTKAVVTIQLLIQGLLTSLQQAVQNVQWYKIGADISNALNAIDWPKLFGSLAKTLSDLLKGALDLVLGLVETLDWAKLGSDLWNSLVQIVTNIDWGGLVSKAAQLLGAVIGASLSLMKGIGEAFWNTLIKGFASVFSYFEEYIDEAGGDVIKGLWNGIKNAVKNVGTWIKTNIFDPFINGFKKAFGIHSPSTVMAEQGWDIVAGLWKGIKDKISSGIDVIKGWAGSVVEWFTKGKDGKGIVENFKELAGNIVSGFKDKVSNTYNNVKSSITTWASKVKDWFTSSSFGGVNMSNFATFANNTIEGFKTKISSAYTNVKTSITTWASKAKDWFTSASFGGVNFNTFSTFANNTIEGFKTKIGSAYTNVKSNITTWASGVKEWFTSSSFGGVNNTNWQTFANNTIEGFKTKIGNAYTNTKSNIMTWASNVKSWFTENGYGGVNNTNWQTFANNVIEGFKTKIGNAYTNTKANITTWASSVKSWFSDIASNSAFAGFATNVIDGFKTRIGNYYTTAKSGLTTFANAVKDWFEKPDGTTLVTHFLNIGKNIIQGFIDGVSSLWNAAMEKIKAFGRAIIGAGKEGTEEHSPSKAFVEIGAFVIKGFNIGVENTMASTFKLLDGWTNKITAYTPTVGFAVDTSTLKHYNSSAYARSISANISTQHEFFSDDGFERAIDRALDRYYDSHISSMAGDMRRQADKKETTEVHVGNRVITDAVETQRQANGFRFVTT